MSKVSITESIAAFQGEYSYGSPKTAAFYRDQLRAFQQFADMTGMKTMDEINGEKLREYLEHAKGTGISQRTLIHRYNSVMRFLSWCAGEVPPRIAAVPKVRRPKEPVDTRVGYSAEQLRALVSTKQGTGWIAARDTAIIALFVSTGARANELLSLTTKSLEKTPEGKYRLALHGKGDKKRFVPVGGKAVEALQHYLTVRPKSSSDALFISQRHQPLNYGALWMMLKNAGVRAGVDSPQAHRFRHSFAATFFTQHHDTLALRNLLGHTRIQTTEQYLRTLGHEYGTDGRYAPPDEVLL